jgi:hypothetical protein
MSDFVLPPDMSPKAREYFQQYKDIADRFIARMNRKPFGWETIETQQQMFEELTKLTDSFPPGTVGTAIGGGPDPLEIHQYKGFVIAIHTIPRLNGQYSTLSGIRKADAPIPQEPFPMSKQEFPTHEAAAKAALEECMGKIDLINNEPRP